MTPHIVLKSSFLPRVTNSLALSSLPMYQPSTPLLVLLQYCIRPCKFSCYSNLHTFMAWHILCSHNRNHWITALLKFIVHCILLYSLGFHLAIRSQRHASSQWLFGTVSIPHIFINISFLNIAFVRHTILLPLFSSVTHLFCFPLNHLLLHCHICTVELYY